MNLRNIDVTVCPVCGAISPTGAAFDHHIGWHLETETMLGWNSQDAIKRAQDASSYVTEKAR